MSDNIPQQHKDLLYSNPEKYRDYFEKTYGFGSASKVLQQLQEEKDEAENKRGVISDIGTQAVGGIADATQEVLDFGQVHPGGIFSPVYESRWIDVTSEENIGFNNEPLPTGDNYEDYYNYFKTHYNKGGTPISDEDKAQFKRGWDMMMSGDLN